ncbi:hypothetical protein C8Q78DRAFT_1042302 [Trametes maxima]|nr:hypothetical protein C8Q78DRAFT_1042302 [Trametes maxima]
MDASDLDLWTVHTGSRKRSRTLEKTLQHEKFFLQNHRTGYYKCLLCDEHQYEPLSRAIQHEDSARHTRKVRMHDRPDEFSSPFHTSTEVEDIEDINDDTTGSYEDLREVHSFSSWRSSGEGPPQASTEDLGVHSDFAALPPPEDLVQDGVSVFHSPVYDSYTVHGPALVDDSPDQLYDNWGGELAIAESVSDDSDLLADDLDAMDLEGPTMDPEDSWQGYCRPHRADLQDSMESSQDSVTGLTPKTTQGQTGPGSRAGYPGRWSPGPPELDTEAVLDGLLTGNDSEASVDALLESHKHAPDLVISVEDEHEKWWPWPDQETCLLDVTGAFPRSLFSESEMRGTRWVAGRSGARRLPSIRQVKTSRRKVMTVAGTSPQHHHGRCGHLYATADLPTIIKHEFANPLVRPNIEVYAEDAGDQLKHPRQAKKWAHEVDPNLSAPMARNAEGKDFFVNELAMANIDSLGYVAPVVPVRWFSRDGALLSVAYPVRLRNSSAGERLVIDARVSQQLEIPLTAFILNVDDLLDAEVQRVWSLPAPDAIDGLLRHDDPHKLLEEWMHPVRNRWRERAQGARVYGLPIWLYCDDTSGNVSKKWNKHNSVLFVLGGLPRELSQLLYNVHFLSTSNLASPLEMMEQITAMLRDASADGIKVWDCLHKEDVLVVPWVLAFQGDNPMASEFASHVGMMGNCMCRVCHATRGHDKGGDHDTGVAREKSRLADFMSAGRPRTKAETLKNLAEQEERAFGGAPSATAEMATATGTKDKYFQHFVDKLQVRLNKWRTQQKRPPAPAPEPATTGDEGLEAPPEARGPEAPESQQPSRTERQAEFLQKMRSEMPDNIYNPVLLLEEFEPNADSPFEALHVVLLGVVKYWWRDACARQDQQGKAALIARLSSTDIAGLGISRLRGHTLVNYAGSLVGHDFRIILQVAPSALHGLVPQPAYEAWLALCRLAPLIFQPEINNLSEYQQCLKDAIADFLAATALWNTQWFNKTKFHLFVHVLTHILRFGPAILFATETFESYNLVIRLRSVNSNKHAPSLDIARSFSHLHAVRHLVSGGYVERDEEGLPIPPRQAGDGVRTLLHDREFLELMSMSRLFPESRAGFYHPLETKQPTTAAENTMTALVLPNLAIHAGGPVTRCRSIVLNNEDIISIQGYVAFTNPKDDPSAGRLYVGRIDEILAESKRGDLDGALVTLCSIGPMVAPYRMPACRADGEKFFISFKNLVAAVSTFHNCVAHGCTVTRSKVVMQERQETENREDEVVHDTQTIDRVLNTAQLRNAAILQRIQVVFPRYPGQAQDVVIDRAIENKLAAEWAAEQRRQEVEKRRELAGANSRAPPGQQGRRRARNRIMTDLQDDGRTTPLLTPLGTPASTPVRPTIPLANASGYTPASTPVMVASMPLDLAAWNLYSGHGAGAER